MKNDFGNKYGAEPFPYPEGFFFFFLKHAFSFLAY